MSQEFGLDWRDRLASFEMKPFAAASIGQVHSAVLRDGTEVAMKIQYPGVAQGIESDIDNLVGIMKVWNIFPEGEYILMQFKIMFAVELLVFIHKIKVKYMQFWEVYLLIFV